jgi:hypothetical protein
LSDRMWMHEVDLHKFGTAQLSVVGCLAIPISNAMDGPLLCPKTGSVILLTRQINLQLRVVSSRARSRGILCTIPTLPLAKVLPFLEHKLTSLAHLQTTEAWQIACPQP